MTHTLQSTFVGTGVFVLTLIAFALPFFTYAADYAFVNSQGYVALVTAPNPSVALLTATNIDIHSGVCLLDSAAEHEMVGDFVKGA